MFTVVKPRSKSLKKYKEVISAIRLFYPIMPLPIKRELDKRGIFVSAFCASSSYVEHVLRNVGFIIEKMQIVLEQTYPHYLFIAKKK